MKEDEVALPELTRMVTPSRGIKNKIRSCMIFPLS